MATQQGNSSIATNGLVFAYDTGDTVNSYQGRPTTNLVANDSMSTYNNVGGDVSITLTQTADTYQGAYIWREDITPTTSAGVSYLTNGNNPGIGVVSNGGGGTANTYTGFSIFFKPTGPMWSNPIYTNYSNIGGWQSSTLYTYVGDGWYKAYVTWYDTVTRSDGKYWAINPAGAVQGVPITVFWAGPFKESLNSPYISQFTNGTRSNTQGLIDLSGTGNSIDLSTMTYNSNVQPVFDGTNSYLNFPSGLNASFANNQITIVSVASVTSTVSKPTAITFAGTVGFQFPGNRISPTLPMMYWDSGVLWKTGTNAYTIGTTQFFAWTINGTALTFYNNGLNVGTATVSNFNPTPGAAVRIGLGNAGEYMVGSTNTYAIYNRTLSAGEIYQNYLHYKSRFNLT